MRVCENCLEETSVRKTPVGHEKGHQHDPYRVQLDLCEMCSEALVCSNWTLIHQRFADFKRVEQKVPNESQ